MTPEQKARVSIDTLLQQAGWHVCDMAKANIHAARGVALREFPLNTGFGFADYPSFLESRPRSMPISSARRRCGRPPFVKHSRHHEATSFLEAF